jgi:GNAT superfamily N-acetyltransferase
MDGQVQISCMRSLPSDLETLRREAGAQGFGFIDRLCADWASGANRFGRPGECFLGAFANGKSIGVGGLNIDPYLDRAHVGRIRHVYVLHDWRRKGIGRTLVSRLLDEARRSFREVRLRTNTDQAASFYLQCGFRPVDDATASHGLTLA